MTVPELRHYAAEPVALDRSREYETAKHNLKPDGLWVSIPGEDDWPSWCRREDFHTESLAHEHVVALSESADILYLTSLAEVIDFHEAYRHRGEAVELLDRYIDWARVKARYDGIVIAPYQWPLRLDLIWYYGWDCASGCIWNLDAIESINALSEVGR